jgi:hypothetical protein
MLAQLEKPYFKGYFSTNFFYSMPLQNLLSATYLICYVALFSSSALKKKFTNFFLSFSKFCRSPIVRSLSIQNSYDILSTSTFVHCNWMCDWVGRGFKMTGDPLHLVYEDSALLWHDQVYIFVSKHLNEVWRCNEGTMKGEATLLSRLEDTFNWRDRIVTPSSPPCKMATCAPPVYAIPHNDDD